jgi:hypothetical protein
LDIFSLEGQVPEIHVFVSQAYISNMAEYDWYEWVKYRDTSVNFPDTKVKLGRDLLQAIDIGPAMALTILKSNGHTTYKTDVRSLTPKELVSSDEVQLSLEYDKAIRDKLGAPMSPDDYKDDPDFADFDISSHVGGG